VLYFSLKSLIFFIFFYMAVFNSYIFFNGLALLVLAFSRNMEELLSWKKGDILTILLPFPLELLIEMKDSFFFWLWLLFYLLHWLCVDLLLEDSNVRLCLFYTCFCVRGVKNAVRCLVIVKITFYTAGPTKKLNLKCSFHEAIFTCFFNWVS